MTRATSHARTPRHSREVLLRLVGPILRAMCEHILRAGCPTYCHRTQIMLCHPSRVDTMGMASATHAHVSCGAVSFRIHTTRACGALHTICIAYIQVLWSYPHLCAYSMPVTVDSTTYIPKPTHLLTPQMSCCRTDTIILYQHAEHTRRQFNASSRVCYMVLRRLATVEGPSHTLSHTNPLTRNACSHWHHTRLT